VPHAGRREESARKAHSARWYLLRNIQLQLDALNPVKRELIFHSEEGQWSSWAHFGTGERGLIHTDAAATKDVAPDLGNPYPRSRKRAARRIAEEDVLAQSEDP
jgi:hypothetical protein